MSTTCLTQQLQGKPIISVTNGEIIAKVLDVLVDPETRHVAAAITSKGSMLARQREIDVIPADEVQVWGQDAVLVKRPDVIVKDNTLSDRERWLSVSEQIKGHAVIGTDGTRIGQLNDVVIDVDGQFVGYDLVQPFVPAADPKQKMKQIPADATSVLGQDVLIIAMPLVPAPPQVEETAEAEELPGDEDVLSAEDLKPEEEPPQAEETPETDEDTSEPGDEGGLF